MQKNHVNNQVKTVAEQLPSSVLLNPKDGKFGVC